MKPALKLSHLASLVRNSVTNNEQMIVFMDSRDEAARLRAKFESEWRGAVEDLSTLKSASERIKIL